MVGAAQLSLRGGKSPEAPFFPFPHYLLINNVDFLRYSFYACSEFLDFLTNGFFHVARRHYVTCEPITVPTLASALL